MRVQRAWGLQAALVLGLTAGGAAAADKDDQAAKTKAARGNWLSGWFSKDKPAVKKKDLPKEDVKESDPTVPTAVETAAAARQREMQTLLRRLNVCDRLREIALETNDPELGRRAEELDARAWQVYTQRTGGQPGGVPDFESDERILDKHLGAGRAAVAPRQGPGKDRGSRAARKEESR
jgi:hypothetical protein